MAEAKKPVCGIVMPISDCDGLKESHWHDVLQIITLAAEEEGLETRLVSETFDSNLIHKEILQNIYQDDIIICDVSGRNPNVFFELGIRMATQKPTVIVKDDKTAYPFDMAPNRYVEYPRDLRHPAMEKFKAELKKSISNTIDQPIDKSFIGQLGPFKILDVESAVLPASEIILERLDRIDRLVSTQKNSNSVKNTDFPTGTGPTFIFTRLSRDEFEIRISDILISQVERGILDFRKSEDYSALSFDLLDAGRLQTTVRVAGKSTQKLGFQSDFAKAITEAIPF